MLALSARAAGFHQPARPYVLCAPPECTHPRQTAALPADLGSSKVRKDRVHASRAGWDNSKVRADSNLALLAILGNTKMLQVRRSASLAVPGGTKT
jgi:hypothetical protein